jgi:polyhydroxybutyrate depolymerase
MATHYVSQRRSKPVPHATPRPQSRTTFMHHVAWGIVCVILIAVMGGLGLYAQNLQVQNGNLRHQLAIAKEPPTTCRVSEKWSPGQSKEKSLVTVNGDRRYMVHVPADYRDNKYYPLVFFYSGKGSSALGSELTFGLDSLPAITVYPFPTAGTDDGLTAWLSAPYASGADDVGFTSSILDELQTNMCIDKTRVYATGFSNGGGFAALLSCKLPGRFAAYAVEAGALYYPDGECSPPGPSPIISIHGDEDPIIPYEGVTWRNLPSISDWTSMRASLEKCNQPPATFMGVTTVVTTWDNCRGGSTVENIRVLGGDHAWGEVSNDTLWQFLSRFTL